jgi:hypothetical protein
MLIRTEFLLVTTLSLNRTIGTRMIALFKSDPTKTLRKRYQAKLEEAMLAQRKGDIKTYSFITAEAEELLKEIEGLESSKS